MINIVGSSRYVINRKLLRQFVRSWFDKYQIAENTNLNIVFVGKRKMRQVAGNYKKEDVALPVLSFGYNTQEGDGQSTIANQTQEEQLLGEIIICYPQAVLLAAERNKKVDDILQQLITHGLTNLINSPK